jgi:LmbE family N-acetylglucosaminyl deacetylase
MVQQMPEEEQTADGVELADITEIAEVTNVAEIVEIPEVAADPVPSRVLVIVAHPDDVDFGAAGTVAVWSKQGCEVTYCIITDGAAGLQDTSVDIGTLAETREREQREAAGEVGVGEVVFLRYRDGELEPTIGVRRDLSRVIRRIRPDRIIAQSPERNYDRIRASHPDHLAAGEAALRAVYPDARNPYAFPELLEEGLEPHEVAEVWLMASPQADRAIDITDVFDAKVAALSCHRSQILDPDAVAGFVRGWTAATAMHFGLPEGRLAEAFQVVDTR